MPVQWKILYRLSARLRGILLEACTTVTAGFYTYVDADVGMGVTWVPVEKSVDDDVVELRCINNTLG